MYEVRDGSRILQFDGKMLGESSSESPESTRWIEFKLYKTESGSYVISRVGVSLIYHGAACTFVQKYGLNEIFPEKLRNDSFPCEECNPSRKLPYVFPERDRTWAYVTTDPVAVIEALYKYDHKNNPYLTNVAKRLLEDAADNDEQLDMVYRLETIP